MSKKGLSADEKAAKLLGWFHSTREFYSLKEIEKAGAKGTGISNMQIKDILQTLLDDSLVNVEKIGTSNYYWSYPGASAAKLQTDFETARAQVEEGEIKLAQARAELELLRAARGGGEAEEEATRQQLLADYHAKRQQLDNINAELSHYAEGDPAVYEQKKKDIEAMKESALRWTDQISSLIAYARDNLNVESQQMREMVDLPEEYEELSFP